MPITVGQLLNRLSYYNRNARIMFGDNALDFYRLKHRGYDPLTGEEVVQVEFNQLLYRNGAGELIAEDVS